eukprot:jgi/Undpi1/7327/HiC_scaffold_22.g09800.m1
MQTRVQQKKQRTKLTENSALISECNSLRKENNALKRKNEVLRLEAKETAARPTLNHAGRQQQQQNVRPAAAPQGSAGVSTVGMRGRGGISGADDETGPEGLLKYPGVPDEGASLQSRSIADTASLTVVQAPETGTSFVPAPSPWDPNTPTAILAAGGVAGKIQPQASGGRFKLDIGQLGGVDGAAGDGLGGGGRGGGGGGLTTASKVNSTRLGGKKSKSQQQLLPSHQQQPAGMGTASEQQQQQNHSRSRLSSSASLSVLLQSPQHQQQAHQRHPLHQGRHQALGRATVGNRGGVRGGGGGGRGLSLTPVSTSSRVIKGGTRGLYAQAALTGGTLQLERALDEKERELHLYRAEISGLRERLRTIDVAARRASDINANSRYQPAALSAADNPQPRPGGNNGSYPPTGIDNIVDLPPPSLLGPTWGGSGRGGTAPYPDAEGSRPISPSDGSPIDLTGAGEAIVGGRFMGSLGGGGGGGAVGGAASAPPGAHVAVLRGAGQGPVDPDLVVEPSGVRTGNGGG